MSRDFILLLLFLCLILTACATAGKNGGSVEMKSKDGSITLEHLNPNGIETFDSQTSGKQGK